MSIPDLGSRVRFIFPSLTSDPDAGSRGHKSTGSRIRIRNTAEFGTEPSIMRCQEKYYVSWDKLGNIDIKKCLQLNVFSLQKALIKI
jgi:hypothetical protein